MNSGRLLTAAVAAVFSFLVLMSCSEPETVYTVPGSEGVMVATTRSAASQRTGVAKEASGNPEGVLRRHGEFYYVKDRDTTLLTRPGKVARGLYLEHNGQVSIEDGRRINLTEGYMVTAAGDLLEAPPYLR